MRQCAEEGKLTYSCPVDTFLPEFCHLIRRAMDLTVVVLFGGKRASLASCCAWCCCNYSAVWGIFALTFCIPFPSLWDWNKSMHYGLSCGKLIALDVYVFVSTELDCTVWSSLGCIWQYCVLFYLHVLCVQLYAIIQRKFRKYQNHSSSGCRV